MAGERIYQNQSGALVEIAARAAGKRYRMQPVSGAMAYIEFTAAEEAARDAEEAAAALPLRRVEG